MWKLLTVVPILLLVSTGCIDEARQAARAAEDTAEIEGKISFSETQQAMIAQTELASGALTEQVEVLASETPSPTPMFSWEGSWTIFGISTEYIMTLTQSGNTISGSFNDGDSEIIISGVVSLDHSFVSGEWEDSDHSYGIFSGPFEWKQINANQFIGNLEFNNSTEGAAAWCGARNGASQPDPCFGP
jgi:hypothetical protein